MECYKQFFAQESGMNSISGLQDKNKYFGNNAFT